MENLKHAVLMAVNAAQRVRDAIYLDTNAWSILAKRLVPVEPLAQWAERNGCFLWLARMQLAELAARRDVVEGLADVLERVAVVMVDRGQNEFDGEPWHRVKLDLQQYLRLNTAELRRTFVEEFVSKLDPVRGQLKEDGERFRQWLDEALAGIPPTEPRDWSGFVVRMQSWVRQMCARNGRPTNEKSINDPTRYVGVRLGYSVLFHRYYVNRQSWKDSDYLDYLHATDMAYAKLVITERSLAESIRQANRRPEIEGPEIVVDTSWLRALHHP
jgi:hypothetical protein